MDATLRLQSYLPDDWLKAGTEHDGLGTILDDRADQQHQGFLDAFARDCTETGYNERSVETLLALVEPLVRYFPVRRAEDPALTAAFWEAYDNMAGRWVYAHHPHPEPPPVDIPWRTHPPGILALHPVTRTAVRAWCQCPTCTRPRPDRTITALAPGDDLWICPRCCRAYLNAHLTDTDYTCPACYGIALLRPRKFLALGTDRTTAAPVDEPVPERKILVRNTEDPRSEVPERKVPLRDAETRWTGEEEKKAPAGGRKIIVVQISAHGAEAAGGDTFNVPPGMTIHTQVPDGEQIAFRDLVTAGRERSAPVRTFEAGEPIPNYELSAFTNEAQYELSELTTHRSAVKNYRVGVELVRLTNLRDAIGRIQRRPLPGTSPGDEVHRVVFLAACLGGGEADMTARTASEEKAVDSRAPSEVKEPKRRTEMAMRRQEGETLEQTPGIRVNARIELPGEVERRIKARTFPVSEFMSFSPEARAGVLSTASGQDWWVEYQEAIKAAEHLYGDEGSDLVELLTTVKIYLEDREQHLDSIDRNLTAISKFFTGPASTCYSGGTGPPTKALREAVSGIIDGYDSYAGEIADRIRVSFDFSTHVEGLSQAVATLHEWQGLVSDAVAVLRSSSATLKPGAPAAAITAKLATLAPDIAAVSEELTALHDALWSTFKPTRRGVVVNGWTGPPPAELSRRT
ncbi:hypothetical protein OHV05_37205 (plasmid) [Kitasatospora sp. NBC_00070]|uniref:putative adhesin n=1 Tax=Kitasatospora sp. NBC_00070 TaxID=2975962 RepID=UPI0032458801